jgi:hypothetical protein
MPGETMPEISLSERIAQELQSAGELLGEAADEIE